MIQGFLSGSLTDKKAIRAKFVRYHGNIVKEWSVFAISLFPLDELAQSAKRSFNDSNTRKYSRQKRWLDKRKNLILLGERYSANKVSLTQR